MIDWYDFARQNTSLAFYEAHPEPELRLVVQEKRDKKRRIYPANELLLRLVRDPNHKRVLLTGRPGSGKSYLLSKLHYELAVDLEHEIELVFENVRKQQERQHTVDMEQDAGLHNDVRKADNVDYQPVDSTVIPLLIRLNAFEAVQSPTNEHGTIAHLIEQQLSGFGYSGSIFDLFRLPAEFVVLIDDLDETLTSGTSENLREVHRFVDKALKNSNVHVIMAGRQVATSRFANEFRTYIVQPLRDDELEFLFEQTIDDPPKLVAYLTKWDGLKAFVATPYFANEAASYWQDMSDEEFNLGRLLYALLDNGLVERQMKTENRDRIRTILRERVDLVEWLAFHSISNHGRITDGMMKTTIVGHEIVDFEEWLFLMEFVNREGSMLVWRNKWIHAYFASHYLSRHEVAAHRTERVAILRSLASNDSIQLVPPILPIVTILLQDLTGEDYSTDVPEIFENLELQLSERERQKLAQDFEYGVAEYIKTRLMFQNVRVSFKPRYVGDGEIDVWATKQEGNKHVVRIAECKLRWPRYPKPIRPEYVSQLKKYEGLVRNAEREYAEQNNWVLDFSAILATNGQDRSEKTVELARQHSIEIWDFAIPAQRLTARVDLTKCEMKRIH